MEFCLSAADSVFSMMEFPPAAAALSFDKMEFVLAAAETGFSIMEFLLSAAETTFSIMEFGRAAADLPFGKMEMRLESRGNAWGEEGKMSVAVIRPGPRLTRPDRTCRSAQAAARWARSLNGFHARRLTTAFHLGRTQTGRRCGHGCFEESAAGSGTCGKTRRVGFARMNGIISKGETG
jgi:hypothetical protein